MLADITTCSNYTFVQTEDVGITGECSSEVAADKVIAYATRGYQQVWVITSTSYTTVNQAWAIPMNGYNVASQTTSSTTTSTSATSSTTGTPPATNTPQPSSGLSTGGKAGIGVWVALRALILGDLILLILAQRNRNRIANGGGPAFNLKSENTGPAAVHEPEGLREAGVSELQGRGIPAEIDSRH